MVCREVAFSFPSWRSVPSRAWAYSFKTINDPPFIEEEWHLLLICPLHERLRRRIPMFPRPPTSSRRTYASCDPLATAINVVKGIPRSLGASSRRPSLENAGPGCHRWFDYCSLHGEGPLMARKDFSGWNLRSFNDVLILQFLFSTTNTVFWDPIGSWTLRGG